ncbi:hypothetical protein CEXT_353791 [Caerostris extrusa]|uniref:Uncharacterized protein n=1 Tax=Caerostris extrusa TaxID=172846 RepID=A0AAV4X4Y0_CAEEX|nr:hypothetical protein CEXT_353791 [Caerostris extrusa]
MLLDFFLAAFLNNRSRGRQPKLEKKKEERKPKSEQKGRVPLDIMTRIEKTVWTAGLGLKRQYGQQDWIEKTVWTAGLGLKKTVCAAGLGLKRQYGQQD